MPHIVEEDQYSDAPDTLEDDRYDDLPRGIQQVEVHTIESPTKTITITSGQDKEGNSIVEANRGPSISSTAEGPTDSASARSVPVVTVSRAQPPETETARNASPSATSTYVPPPSPARSSHSARPSVVSNEDRRSRRRSVTEVRVFHSSIRTTLTWFSPAFHPIGCQVSSTI